jgi:hypothetical protein
MNRNAGIEHLRTLNICHSNEFKPYEVLAMVFMPATAY